MANARSNTVPAPIPAGAVIGGKYRIDGPLAEGGMGVVYRGTHLVLDQPVAIKVVRPELTRCPEAVARFLREARTIASLRGEHITRVLDSGCIKDGPPYMVLEFLEGADLRTLLQRRGPFPMQRAVDLVLQVCEAIAEAHAQGLVHRDIKPENLFLTRRPDGTDCIKVLDFGISKRMNMGDRSYTSQGQSLGSPHYMAPEQMSSPGDVDARADIWSIGVVAFELISGTVPFDGDSLATVCARVLCRPPASLRSVAPAAPVGLEGVILRCLRKPPADRYPTIRALAEALAPYGSEDPTSLLRIRRLAGPQKPILELVPLLPEDEAEPALSESESSDSQRTTRAGFRSKGRPLRAVGIALAAAAAVVAVPYWTAVQKLASDISTDVAAAAASLSATGLVEPKAPRASRYDAPPVPPLSAAVAAYPGHTTPAGGGLLAAPDAPDVAPGPREEASEPAVVRAAAGAESSRGGVQHAASERRKRAGIPAGYRSAPQPEPVPEPEPLPSLTLEPEPEPEPKNGDAGSEAARAPQAEPAEPEPVQRLAGQASSAEPEAAETPPRPRQDLRGALRSADAHTGPRYARPGP